MKAHAQSGTLCAMVLRSLAYQGRGEEGRLLSASASSGLAPPVKPAVRLSWPCASLPGLPAARRRRRKLGPQRLGAVGTTG